MCNSWRNNKVQFEFTKVENEKKARYGREKDKIEVHSLSFRVFRAESFKWCFALTDYRELLAYSWAMKSYLQATFPQEFDFLLISLFVDPGKIFFFRKNICVYRVAG